MKLRIRLIFRWYDFWVGFFWDRTKEVLYFFPIPTLGIMIFSKAPYRYCIWCKQPKAPVDMEGDEACKECEDNYC